MIIQIRKKYECSSGGRKEIAVDRISQPTLIEFHPKPDQRDVFPFVKKKKFGL